MSDKTCTEFEVPAPETVYGVHCPEWTAKRLIAARFRMSAVPADSC
jgi:hypothetical protein